MKKAYLFGYPIFRNIGDHLLWNGCYQYLSTRFQLVTDEVFLKNHGFYRSIPDSAIDDFLSALTPNDVIFFKGGGYFNDASGNFLRYVCQIMKRVSGQKVFFLPQSINLQNNSPLYLLLQSVFSGQDISIVARERISYEIATNLFPSCSVFLNTDMAFYLYPLVFDESLGKDSHGIYFNLRSDGEEKRSPVDEFILYNALIPALRSRTRVAVEDLMDHGSPTDTKLNLAIAIHRTSSFNFIVTNRLHGHILSLLMNKPTILLCNAYHKNRSFYETWLTDVGISRLANSFWGLPKNIKLLKTVGSLSAIDELNSLSNFDALDKFIFKSL